MQGTGMKQPRRNIELQMWLEAQNLAIVAMGKTKVWGEKPHWAAYDDPLACVTLTEAIVQVAKRAYRPHEAL